LDPARRSTFSKTSLESVMEVFSFILLSYYRPANFASGAIGHGRNRALEDIESQRKN